jgi:hypothetical protein
MPDRLLLERSATFATFPALVGCLGTCPLQRRLNPRANSVREEVKGIFF